MVFGTDWVCVVVPGKRPASSTSVSTKPGCSTTAQLGK